MIPQLLNTHLRNWILPVSGLAMQLDVEITRSKIKH